jgi:hypothetical protein
MNELTLPQRAAVALDSAKHRKELAELIQKSAAIVSVTNSDGREEAHRAGMVLKTARVTIQKRGKEAREDATAFSKAVIAEEKSLIDIIEPEESRIIGLRDAWDEKIAAERRAKIEAEHQRVELIREHISDIRAIPSRYLGKSASAIEIGLADVAALEIDEDRFAEFCEEAAKARHAIMGELREMLETQTAAEAEAARLKAEQEAEAARLKEEREELDRLRAEAEQRRQEDERKAAETRAAQEAQLKAEREQQERELAAQLAEAERIRKLEDGQRAFQQQQEREALERQNADMRLERARLAQGQAALAEAQRQRDEKEAERKRLQEAADQLLADALKRESPPTPGEIVYLVAETYLVPHATAAEWLVTLDFRGFVPALEAA